MEKNESVRVLLDIAKKMVAELPESEARFSMENQIKAIVHLNSAIEHQTEALIQAANSYKRD